MREQRSGHPAEVGVIGVLGASGGLGASSFAAVLARVAGAWAGRSVLVDLDPAGGGVDVVAGCEAVPGARWSGLRLAGGDLDPTALADGLPRSGPCLVLAADRLDADASAIAQVVNAATTLGPVVLDLPRGAGHLLTPAVERCDLVVVLVRPDVGGLVAARAACASVPDHAAGLVVRRVGRRARRSAFTPPEVASLVGARVLGTLPPCTTPRPVAPPGRAPRAHRRVAAGILAGVGRRASVAPPGGSGAPVDLATVAA